ncbi:anti-anti-sigma regulatory factor (antagonist of anti-sigma factor) [Thiovulum sp. ES]|nr:anti-anti-sigma regulatory factor (antagonist of anti-sigma factor) [Thiovulum sp. ES]
MPISQLDTNKIEELQGQLLNAGIPVLDVADDIAMVPLIGLIDSAKSQKLMEDMLYNIKTNETKIIILDILGISVVDSAVASHLIKITKATKLMGCETIISGISPSIAQTMVNLGIEIENLITTATLKNALSLAYQKTGYVMKKLNG